jgi:hypothetical protein
MAAVADQDARSGKAFPGGGESPWRPTLRARRAPASKFPLRRPLRRGSFAVLTLRLASTTCGAACRHASTSTKQIPIGLTYERGRAWATIAPKDLDPRSKLAVRLLEAAFGRKWII